MVHTRIKNGAFRAGEYRHIGFYDMGTVNNPAFTSHSIFLLYHRSHLKILLKSVSPPSHDNLLRYHSGMKANRNTQKGFTLIELIIVLAILGVSLAIAVPNFMVVQTNTEFSADLATIGMIEKSEAHYHALYHTHSFDESAKQSADNFQDSLNNLKDLIDPVDFKVITNVHWARENNRWYIAYDTTSSASSDDADGEEYPEWDQNQDHYIQGDRVVYNGRIFEARYWTNTKPGLFDSHWDEITHEWRSFNEYKAEDTVVYNGHTYSAKHWSKNDIPGISPVWEFVE